MGEIDRLYREACEQRDAERVLADDLANVLSRYAYSPPRAKYADVAAVLARYRAARQQ